MRQHDAAHQAHDPRHFGQRHRDDHDEDARLGQRNQRDGEHDRRNRHHAVHHPHHHRVHRAQIAADEADRQSDQRGERRHRQADDERDATAVNDAAVRSRVRTGRCRTSCRRRGCAGDATDRSRSGRRWRATARRSTRARSRAAARRRSPPSDGGGRTRRRAARAGGGDGYGCGRWSPSLTRSIPDPRVEHGVEHVDHQVDDDVRAREHEDDALDHRIVAAQDRVDRQARRGPESRTRSR